MNRKHSWEFMADETTGSYGAYCSSCDKELTAEQVSSILNQSTALLDVVRDCVNFLADLNSTSPFDSEYMVYRAKALHKRAYTAHSKAKED